MCLEMFYCKNKQSTPVYKHTHSFCEQSMMTTILNKINSHIFCVGENKHAKKKSNFIDSKIPLTARCTIIYVPLGGKESY